MCFFTNDKSLFGSDYRAIQLIDEAQKVVLSGTSLLIAISGIAVIWFAGINHKYFIYTMLGFVISLPFIIAFLKPYQKLR